MKKSKFIDELFDDFLGFLNPVESYQNSKFPLDSGIQNFFNLIFSVIMAIMTAINIMPCLPIFLSNRYLTK